MRPCDVAKIWLKPMVLWNTSILDKPHVVVILLLSMLVNEKSLESWPKTITMAPCFAKRLKAWHCKYIKCQKHNIILRKKNLAKQKGTQGKTIEEMILPPIFPMFFFTHLDLLQEDAHTICYCTCCHHKFPVPKLHLPTAILWGFLVFPYISQFIPGYK